MTIAGNWNGFPVNFTTGVDATATGLVAPFEGQLWFFSGSQYLRYDPAGDQVTVPVTPIANGWTGMPDTFAQGVDAAIHGLGAFLGIIWFFRGGEYVRYSLPNDMVEFGPAPIVGNWGEWPARLPTGSTRVLRQGKQEHIFFFRGNEYIRYNLPADRVEEGPAKVLDLYPVMGGSCRCPSCSSPRIHAHHVPWRDRQRWCDRHADPGRRPYQGRVPGRHEKARMENEAPRRTSSRAAPSR